MDYKVHISIPFTYDIEANSEDEANEKGNELCRQAEKEAAEGIADGTIEAMLIEVEKIC